MLHILRIMFRNIIHASIRNLKLSNIDVQQEKFSKKGVNYYFRLLFEVSFNLSSERKNSRLCLDS